MIQKDKNQLLPCAFDYTDYHKTTLKLGIVSTILFVCHSPYYEASHYLRMKSIPVAQARGTLAFQESPGSFTTFAFALKASNGRIPSPPTRLCSRTLSSLWPPALPSTGRALCTVGQHRSHTEDHVSVSIPPLFPASLDAETILLTPVTSGNFRYLVSRSEVQLTKHLSLQ